MERYDLSRRTLDQNLSNHGYRGKVELLWCDNGTKDPRMFRLADQYRPVYFRQNSVNEGCAKGFNQLILRSTGDYIVLMGNDILMPKNWLDELVKYANHVPRVGLVGMRCTAEIPPMTWKFDCWGHFLDKQFDKVFGNMLFSRQLVDEIGGLCEEFGPYGLEDSNFNDRINMAGFNSLYVPANHFVSTHIGDDVGNADAYRKAKDESLAKNLTVFYTLREDYRTGRRPLKEPLPTPKEPI
jgi:GT2 family glycosyltransferase